ncbi:hypothetical protein M430DRAFT_33604 [Amorphotheca resinae ATCC 22711]|uniref:Uncharacterized protein n=1 Tax=Amorphotheca resinae ATCC 22711 TaxID=857342 RepID=A0A2T3B7V9_AMORE|nr:hypothetical protein M430DRAFT_33604 [Amorphotheca resinae ATCC 22711]PSS22950.1 hypothetical protein M430DRAFT_33604 [Amorphotheca resinae ATCC 22711]
MGRTPTLLLLHSTCHSANPLTNHKPVYNPVRRRVLPPAASTFRSAPVVCFMSSSLLFIPSILTHRGGGTLSQTALAHTETK